MFVEERRAMKLGWSALDGVSADRLWLRPSGLISGRAAAEAIASGHARPLTGPHLAYNLGAVLGLGSDRRPISYAVFCLKKKTRALRGASHHGHRIGLAL